MLLSLFPLLVFLQGWARRQESLTVSRLLALVGAQRRVVKVAKVVSDTI
jgi:hypothetical protein